MTVNTQLTLDQLRFMNLYGMTYACEAAIMLPVHEQPEADTLLGKLVKLIDDDAVAEVFVDACLGILRLQEHGFAFTETAVVVVEIAGERQLQDVLAALLEAELNIHYTYPFLNRPAGKSALVLNVEHPEVAVDSLRRHYFTVLYQGDVSR